MANKKEYKEKQNQGGGIPETLEDHEELIDMLITHILSLEKKTALSFISQSATCLTR